MPKISYPKTDREKARLYLHCMVELRLRAQAVNDILVSPALPLFQAEACYLHFRHMCELIAIGCLAAQGDYQSHRHFTESYSPPQIFNAMREFYPDFFPHPAQLISQSGSHHIAMDPVEGAYGEADVTRLWNISGDHLHRASVKKYLKRSFAPAPDTSQLLTHLNGIVLLMQQHIVPLRVANPDRYKLFLHTGFAPEPATVQATFIRLDQEASTARFESYTSKLA